VTDGDKLCLIVKCTACFSLESQSSGKVGTQLLGNRYFHKLTPSELCYVNTA